MDKRTTLSLVTGIATVVAVFAFMFTLRSAFFGGVAYVASDAGFAPPTRVEASTTSPPARVSDFETPLRLRIPAISVDAKVQHVGLTKNNAMGVPTNFRDVGWYKHGSVPGEMGSAVIAGHVDNALGLSGVFKRLKDLEPGDDIYVIDKDGVEIIFTVTSVDRYRYDEAPTEEIFNETGEPLLRLITCGGKWIQSKKTYDERIVVTARLY